MAGLWDASTLRRQLSGGNEIGLAHMKGTISVVAPSFLKKIWL